VTLSAGLSTVQRLPGDPVAAPGHRQRPLATGLRVQRVDCSAAERAPVYTTQDQRTSSLLH